MDTLDIEFEYEYRKRQVLAKIEKLKDEWQEIWGKCVGDQNAEALAVQAKLRIQLMEAEAIEELKIIEQKILALKNKIIGLDGEGESDQGAEPVADR